MVQELLQRLDAMPLVAILRGLRPEEAVDIGEAIVAAGFCCLEVPLNSPEPLESVRRLRSALGERAIIGAGTVLEPGAVDEVAEAGGQVIISPNTNPDVIRRAKSAGLLSMPGFLTPTEAFTALAAGAEVLKLFPAEIAGRAGLKAVRAVLPASTRVYAVGGVEPRDAGGWMDAGASGLGLGSAVYRPGRTPEQVSAAASDFVAAWQAERKARNAGV